MGTYDWTGLGLAAGTVITNANINAVGNGTGTMLYAGLSGTATRVTVQESNGNGVEIVDTAGGGLARQDTSPITAGSECLAIDFIYKAPATAPTTATLYPLVARNANATPASNASLRHNITTNTLDFRQNGDTGFTGSLTPALVGGDYYQVSMAVIRNTLTTPTTANGRIMGRVRSITAPGTWNAGAEFYVDSGYTINVSLDKTDRYRTGKTGTAGAVVAFRVLNLRWSDTNTPVTSTVKASAIANFVQDAGPTFNTTGTGAGYPIVAVATPVAGGGLTYGITQTAGPTHTPVLTAAPGVWTVVQDTSSACSYDIDVSEAGGGTAVTSIVVPATTTSALGGQFRRRKRVSGAWV